LPKITKLRTLNYFLIFSITLVIFVSSQNEQIIQFAEAQEEAEVIVDQRVYQIRITLMDVGEIELKTGSYQVTFWIALSSDDIDFYEIPPPVVDYVNGKIETIEHEKVWEHAYTAKVTGTFFSNFEFHDYPIAQIELPIIIEPAFHESSEVFFLDDKNVSAPDFELSIPGWKLIDYSFSIAEYQYPELEVYSRYTAIFELETPILSVFMIGIFPIFVMGAVVLLSFLIDPTLEIRPEIITATLIAAVFFHVIDIGEGLPPLEYLTLEDKLMTTLYAVIMFGMLEIAVQRKYNEDKMEKAEVINKKFRMMIPVVVIGTFGLVWFL